MHRPGFTLGKPEKLCRRKVIDQLFNKGKSFLVFPFRVQYLPVTLPEDVSVQVLFSVSKRRFKRAVKRNLLKRRMREAYRLNKYPLYNVVNDSSLQVAVAFVYIGDKELDYKTIEKGMKKALLKLSDEIGKNEIYQKNI
ncbi:ribonuclease P protein component [Thermophagus sp. OGC60D27]|uniref:ribonuclease P protein component n=1 Tax=Thermophagus sp. OGC60D27 TaxID=3458415 RepID=UPI0040378690